MIDQYCVIVKKIVIVQNDTKLTEKYEENKRETGLFLKLPEILYAFFSLSPHRRLIVGNKLFNFWIYIFF